MFYSFLLPLSVIITNAKLILGDDNSTANGALFEFGSLWLPRSFRIACCHGGYPIPENSQMTRNWTDEVSDYTTEYNIDNLNLQSSSKIKPVLEDCRVFQGNYLLSASALFTFLDFNGIGVTCKCPDVPAGVTFDRNCRQLLECINNGYRSFKPRAYCVCPEPYFGEQCEKYCDQGQLMKGAGGRDYCGCVPFYQGDECRDMICLNGGTEANRHCRCPPNFLGYHCEIDTNRSSVVSRFHGYNDQNIYRENDLFTRDVSGTIFSLIMIVVLVLSMYLLMKHRMQVQNRFVAIRREPVDRRTILGIHSRRGNISVPDSSRIFSVGGIPIPDDGPPPYVVFPQRGRTRRSDQLPPLPSYEDATKLTSDSGDRPNLAGPNYEMCSNSDLQLNSDERVPVADNVERNRHLDANNLQSTTAECVEDCSGAVQAEQFGDNNPKFDKNDPTRQSI